MKHQGETNENRQKWFSCVELVMSTASSLVVIKAANGKCRFLYSPVRNRHPAYYKNSRRPTTIVTDRQPIHVGRITELHVNYLYLWKQDGTLTRMLYFSNNLNWMGSMLTHFILFWSGFFCSDCLIFNSFYFVAVFRCDFIRGISFLHIFKMLFLFRDGYQIGRLFDSLCPLLLATDEYYVVCCSQMIVWR